MEVSKLLLRYQEGQRDFRQVSLRNVNLAQAQLAFINLDQADLGGSNFREAQLAGANLVRVDLSNATLVGANLLGASLLSARLVRANLEGALLSGADLRATNLKQANLRNASCVGIDLSGADLREANLTDINLKDANLRGANLLNAKWDRADLEGAQLDGAIMPSGEYVVPEEDEKAKGGGFGQAAPIDEFNFPTLEERIDDDFLRSLATQTSEDQPDSAGQRAAQPLFGDVDLDRSQQLIAPPSAPSAPPATPSDLSGNLGANLSLSERIKSKLQAQNQYQFRRAVSQAYGNQCAITNSRIQVVLKAVAISEEVESGRDHPSNGILLRADLAILFQEHLITLDPKTETVLLAPSLRESEYQVWGGRPVNLPEKPSERPDPELLQQHRNACRWYQAEQTARQRTTQAQTPAPKQPNPQTLWKSALRNLLGRNKPEDAPNPIAQSSPAPLNAGTTPPASATPAVTPAPRLPTPSPAEDVPTGWLGPNQPPDPRSQPDQEAPRVQSFDELAIDGAIDGTINGAINGAIGEDNATMAASSAPNAPATNIPAASDVPAASDAPADGPADPDVLLDPLETLVGSWEELGLAEEGAGASAATAIDPAAPEPHEDEPATGVLSTAPQRQTPSWADRVATLPVPSPSPVDDSAAEAPAYPDSGDYDPGNYDPAAPAYPDPGYSDPSYADPAYDEHPYFNAQAYAEQGYLDSGTGSDAATVHTGYVAQDDRAQDDRAQISAVPDDHDDRPPLWEGEGEGERGAGEQPGVDDPDEPAFTRGNPWWVANAQDSNAQDSDDDQNDRAVFFTDPSATIPEQNWNVPPEPGAESETMPWAAELGSAIQITDVTTTRTAPDPESPPWEADLAAPAPDAVTNASAAEFGDPFLASAVAVPDRMDSTEDEVSQGFPSSFAEVLLAEGESGEVVTISAAETKEMGPETDTLVSGDRETDSPSFIPPGLEDQALGFVGLDSVAGSPIPADLATILETISTPDPEASAEPAIGALSRDPVAEADMLPPMDMLPPTETLETLRADVPVEEIPELKTPERVIPFPPEADPAPAEPSTLTAQADSALNLNLAGQTLAGQNSAAIIGSLLDQGEETEGAEVIPPIVPGIEETTDPASELSSEQTFGQASEQTSEQASEPVPEWVAAESAELVAEPVPEAPEQALEQVSVGSPELAPEEAPEQVPEQAPAQTLDPAPATASTPTPADSPAATLASPVADLPADPAASKLPLPVLIAIVAITAIGVTLGGLAALGVLSFDRLGQSPQPPTTDSSAGAKGATQASDLNRRPDPGAIESDPPNADIAAPGAIEASSGSLSIPNPTYPLAEAASLQAVLGDGTILLQPEATAAFWKMQSDARKAGVRLYPLQGYLDPAAEAEYWQAQEPDLDEEALAELIALSNYHSGYGLDIGDYSVSTSDRSPRFKETAAFKWLSENADRYGFVPWTTAVAQDSLDRPWHWHYNPGQAP